MKHKSIDEIKTLVIILYNYTPTRAGENAKKFLQGMVPGYYLMVDAYQWK